MISSQDLVDRFKSYMFNFYGYSKRAFSNSIDSSLRFMDVDFSFKVVDKNGSALLSVVVEGRGVVEGWDKKILEIEEGSFWEKYLTPEAVEGMREYSSYLRDVCIKKENERYVFEAFVDTDDLDNAFRAVFHYFIRPSLFCARVK